MSIGIPETIRFEITDSIGEIIIDRPPVNAVTTDQLKNYRRFFDDLNEVTDVSVLVLKTTGEKAFLAGHDINEFVDMTPEIAEEVTALAGDMFYAIHTVNKPIIGAIDGPALGTGLGVSSMLDIRYASRNATVGLPEADRGILGGYKFAQLNLPEGRARELMLSADPISAEQAYQDGFIQRVFDTREDLYDAVEELAQRIAEKPSVTSRLAKEAIIETSEMSVHEGYAKECEYSVKLRSFEEANQSSREFFDR